MSRRLGQDFPMIAAWVTQYGWIEVGGSESPFGFVRAFDEGGLVWEGTDRYGSLDEALQALEAGLREWLQGQGVRPVDALLRIAELNTPPGTEPLISLILDGSLKVGVEHDQEAHGYPDTVRVTLVETCPPDQKMLKGDMAHFSITPEQAEKLAAALLEAAGQGRKAPKRRPSRRPERRPSKKSRAD